MKSVMYCIESSHVVSRALICNNNYIIVYRGNNFFLATKYERNPYKKHLLDDLLSNYNRLIRPVQNHSENLTVWMGLKLTQLTEMVIDYRSSRSGDEYIL